MRILLIVLIIPTICFSQPLSQIKTKEQAENYIKDNFRYESYKYDLFVIDSVNPGFDNFKEGDFNHDGITDLLVFGEAHITVKTMTYNMEELIIIIGDKKKPRKVSFPYGYFSGLGSHIRPYPKVIKNEHEDFLLIQYEDDKANQPLKTVNDIVYIMNDHVIPFVNNPSDKVVTKIEFKTDHCFGTCPVFEMTIDKNLKVEYNGIEYVDKKGECKLSIDKKDWDYIKTLIRNLKIEDLEDNYDVDWTDDQTAFLTVVFEDGTKKSIRDYGLSGTYGLSVLYDFIFELSKF